MHTKQLDPALLGEEVQEFHTRLSEKVVGQSPAVRRMTEAYQVYLSGMVESDRPISNILNLGPTGVGKTHVVRSAAEILFGSCHSLVRIDCAEFSRSHEIAKLIGAPPGYVGRETRPLLASENIYRFQRPDRSFAFVLFDEIEKANRALWELLLGILDSGWLGLGDNSVSDFTRTIIVMTSNVGAREMEKLLESPIGFQASSQSTKERDDLDDQIDHTALQAADKEFPPEFMNRLDSVVVFRKLTPAELEQILDIEINRLQERVTKSAKGGFVFHCTAEAKRFLLVKGCSKKYGARPLKRAIEKYLGIPLRSLMTSGQVQSGDLVAVEHELGAEGLEFSKMTQTALIKAGKSSVKTAALVKK